jgi:hypothetical protein
MAILRAHPPRPLGRPPSVIREFENGAGRICPYRRSIRTLVVVQSIPFGLTMTTQYRQALVQLSISAAADRNAESAPDGVDVTCGASARSMPAIATTAAILAETPAPVVGYGTCGLARVQIHLCESAKVGRWDARPFAWPSCSGIVEVASAFAGSVC